MSDVMRNVSRIEEHFYDQVPLSSEDSDLIVALGSGGYSMSRPPGRSGWIQYTGEYGLPTFIARVARSIMEDRGVTLENAIPKALKRVKAWASGKYGVDVDTRDKAVEALVQWERLRDKVKEGKKNEGKKKDAKDKTRKN